MHGRYQHGWLTGRGALTPRGQFERLRSIALSLAVASVGMGALAAGASASGLPQGPPAGPTSPPFTQCPTIGLDSSCEYLIDVTSTDPATRPSVLQDQSQHFFDGEDDVTVAVQNDTSGPLGSIHVGIAGSGDRLFEFDGDGLCWSGISPRPAECPFDPNLNYNGPDTDLVAESADAGTVVFRTPLQPGQYTYFSLESPPSLVIVAGEVNDSVSTTLTNTRTSQSGDALAAPKPVAITDRATIKGLHGTEATGKVEYIVYSDPSCKKPVEWLGRKSVGAGGVAGASDPSSLQLPTNATYFWVARYSGDRQNSPNSSACGSETMSFGAPARPRPSTNGSLKLLALRASEANGQISVTVQLPAAGTLTAHGVVRHGASLARVRRAPAEAAQARRCRRGFVSRRNRCINDAPVLYGSASLNASAPGAETIVIRPTRRVLQALRRGRALHVTVYIRFQDRSGGAALTNVQSVLARIRHSKHRKR